MLIRIMILLGFLLAACTPQTKQPSQDIDVIVVPSATAETSADQIRSAALTDLSKRLALEPARIHVILMESQLWPDSSLGCPQPGGEYAQQTVPGYRLQLEANGVDYTYHTDTKNTVILCMEDDLPSFPVTPGEIDDAEPWMPVE